MRFSIGSRSVISPSGWFALTADTATSSSWTRRFGVNRLRHHHPEEVARNGVACGCASLLYQVRYLCVATSTVLWFWSEHIMHDVLRALIHLIKIVSFWVLCYSCCCLLCRVWPVWSTCSGSCGGGANHCWCGQPWRVTGFQLGLFCGWCVLVTVQIIVLGGWRDHLQPRPPRSIHAACATARAG